MKKQLLLLGLGSLLIVSCSAPNAPEPVIQQENKLTSMIEAQKQAVDERNYQPKVIQFEGRILGGNSFVDRHGLPFPDDMRVVLSPNGPIRLEDILASIQRQTGIPYLIEPSRQATRLLSADDDDSGPTAISEENEEPLTPIIRSPKNTILLSPFHGGVAELLSTVMPQFERDWYYDGSKIKVFTEIARIYALNTIGSSGTLKRNISTQGDGSSAEEGGVGAANEFSTQREITLNFIENIKSDIDIMVPDQYEYHFSESKGTLLVIAPRWVHEEVDEYIQAERARLSRLAHIQLKILSVSIEENESAGFSIDAALNNLGSINSAFSANLSGPTFEYSSGNAPSFSGGFTSGTLENTNLILDALGTTATVQGSREVLKTLSNYQPLTINNITLQQYAESSTTTLTASGLGVTETQTGTLQTGISISLLAAIHDSRELSLDYAISSTGGANFVTFGDGQTESIRLPQYAGTNDMQTINLKSQKPFVLGAIVQSDGTSSQNAGLAGASRNSNSKREVLVILVYPVIEDDYARGQRWSPL